MNKVLIYKGDRYLAPTTVKLAEWLYNSPDYHICIIIKGTQIVITGEEAN